MSRFDKYRQRLQASTDDMFARSVRFEPRGSDGLADTERVKREVVAPVSIGDRENQSFSGSRAGDFATDIRTGGAVIKPNRVTYPDLDIRKDDWVVVTDLPGQPRFKVASVDDREPGRLMITIGNF